MLSALLGNNAADSFGVAGLDEQTPHQRTYAPLPQPTGELIHDPDFALPTTAGPLIWRLFHYSALPDTDGPFGQGWRASWPLRLCADVTGTTTQGYFVTVTLEREDGNSVQYIGNSPASSPPPTTFTAYSPRLFSTLTYNTDNTWDETRFDTGAQFHYLPSAPLTMTNVTHATSLSYYQTVQGRRVTMNYDGNGQLQNIQDPAGRQLAYSYQNGYVSQVQDWASRSHNFLYDDDGNLVQMTDPTGAITLYEYDGQHHLTRITDPNNFHTDYAYDDNDRVVMRSVDGNAGYYFYAGNVTTYQDPLNKLWQTTLDSNGNVVQATDPLSATRNAAYNSQGLPTAIQDALGRITTLTYDNNGCETRRTNPMGQTETRTYDEYGNLLTDMDPLGRITTYVYEGTGATQGLTRQLASRANPAGETTRYTHNVWGAVQSVTTPIGYRHTYNWSEAGVLDNEQNARGYFRTYTHDAAGNLTVEQDEMSRTIIHTYDGVGRQTSSQNQAPATRQTIYDGVGNVQVEIDPLGARTTYSYNAYAKPILQQDANGYLWQTFYDAKGRETGRQDPMTHVTSTMWDIADRRVGAVDGMGRINTTVYDPARQPYLHIDPTGLNYTTLYDLAGRVVGQQVPAGQISTSVYNAAGELIASVEPTGLIYTHRYDAAGRHQVMQEPTGALSTTLYDIDGRAYGSIDPVGRRTTSLYDAVGQAYASIDMGGRIYTTVYDPSGARSLEYAPDGTWTQRFYDAAGRQNGTLDHLALRTTLTLDAADRVRTFQSEEGNQYGSDYDGLGQTIAGTDELGNRFTTVYDPVRRASQYVDVLGNRSTLGYDASHALNSFQDVASNVTNYHYDDSGRFRSVEDALGYRSTSLYDNAGRYAAGMDEAGYATTLIFDPYGRWAATQDALGNRFTTLFDTFGRPVGAMDACGCSTNQVLDLLHRPVAFVDALGYRTTVAYDVLSNVSVQVDELGYRTTHGYDNRGNWTGAQDALGQRATQLYDQFSRPVAYQDALGNFATTLYDNIGRVWAEVDALGNITTTFYDIYGRVWMTQDPDGSLTTTIYDRYGRFAASVDATGQRTTTLFDQYGRVGADMDASGSQTAYAYDPLNRVWATQDALGQRSTTLYDGRGSVSVEIDPVSRRTSMSYDPLNRLYAQTTAANETSYRYYDAVDNLLAFVDACGNPTTYLYDCVGQQIASMDALGYRTSSVYSGRGELLSSMDPMGRRTTSVYDPVGRVVQVIEATGLLTTSVYDRAGRVLASMNPRGYATTYAYDALGRQVGVQDALGYRTSSVYDRRGNRIASLDALGYITTYVYNTLNQQVGVQDALGYRTTMLYDGRGKQIATIDALGRRATTVYDVLGRVQAAIYADNAVATMVYDLAGNRIADIDPLGHVTTSLYDVVNRLTGRTDPLGRRQTFGYDCSGQLQAFTDAKGQTTTHLYDSRNLEVGRVYADGGRVTLAYNSLRQLAGVADSTGLYTFGYDVVGRLSSHVGVGYPQALPITLLYDANGNRGAMQTWQGTFTTSYDARDQTAVLQDPGYAAAGVAGGATSFTYDARRQKVLQVNPNGTSASLIYDPLGRIAQLRHLTSGGAAVEQALYSYDAVGRPAGKSTLGVVSTYGYDTRDRLSSEALLQNYASLTLVPVANGLVINQGFASNAFGTPSVLQVNRTNGSGGSGSGGGYNRVAYLKFDLRALKVAPVSAKLLLTQSNGSPANSNAIPIKVYGVADTSWTEAAITWNNAPGLDSSTGLDSGGTLLATLNVTPQPGAPFSIDLTSFVASHIGQVVTLQVISETASAAYLVEFDARTSSAGRPRLALQTTMRPLPQTLSPIADGPLANLNYASTNQGTATFLQVNRTDGSSGYGYNRVSYIKLDLSGLSVVPTSALLQLTQQSTGFSGVIPVSVYGIADTTWSETGITWNNAPGLNSSTGLDSGGTLLTSQNVTLSGGAVNTFDITSYVAANLGKQITLQLISETASSATLVQFASRKASSGIPQLALSYGTPTQASQAPVADGLIIDGSLAGNNFNASTVIQVNRTNGSGSGYGYDRASYIKLDLSSLSTVPVSAVLQLTQDSGTTSDTNPIVIKVYGVTDISWTEAGLTWNNAPGLDRTNIVGTGVLITSQSVLPLANAVSSFDLTGYIAAHLGEQVTLQLISEAPSAANLIAYNRHTVSTNKPQLSLNYTQALLNPTTYTYDTAGRRTSLQTPALLSTYSYDGADQLLGIQTGTALTTFGYDPNGSATSVQTPLGMTTYGWDTHNRLNVAQPPSGGRYTQVYRYDDLRVGQSSPNGVDTFLYDAFGSGSMEAAHLPNVLLWQRQAGNVPLLTQVYAQDGSSGSGLVRAVGSSAGVALNRQFHTDAMGNMEALTTGSQSVEADYTLDAFGNVLAGSASNNPLVFGGGLGYWQEPDLGLEYIRARWLSPVTGNWLSIDPVTSEPRYSYVRNAPTWRVDPSGLQSWASNDPGMDAVNKAISDEWNYLLGLIGEGANHILQQFKAILHAPENIYEALIGYTEPYARDTALAAARFAKTHHLENTIALWPALLRIRSIPYREGDGARAVAYAKQRERIFGPLARFAPPYLPSDAMAWTIGFYWGLAHQAGSLLLSVFTAFIDEFRVPVSAIISVFEYLNKRPEQSVWQDIGTILLGLSDPVLSLFNGQPRLSAFDYGKDTSNALGYVIVGLLTIYKSAGHLIDLLKKGKTLLGLFRENFGTNGTGGGNRNRSSVNRSNTAKTPSATPDAMHDPTHKANLDAKAKEQTAKSAAQTSPSIKQVILTELEKIRATWEVFIQPGNAREIALSKELQESIDRHLPELANVPDDKWPNLTTKIGTQRVTAEHKILDREMRARGYNRVNGIDVDQATGVKIEGTLEFHYTLAHGYRPGEPGRVRLEVDRVYVHETTGERIFLQTVDVVRDHKGRLQLKTEGNDEKKQYLNIRLLQHDPTVPRQLKPDLVILIPKVKPISQQRRPK